eukprot:SAG31_NODE_3656_length_4020_cov_2.852079_3_plen_385_part_00
MEIAPVVNVKTPDGYRTCKAARRGRKTQQDGLSTWLAARPKNTNYLAPLGRMTMPKVESTQRFRSRSSPNMEIDHHLEDFYSQIGRLESEMEFSPSCVAHRVMARLNPSPVLPLSTFSNRDAHDADEDDAASRIQSRYRGRRARRRTTEIKEQKVIWPGIRIRVFPERAHLMSGYAMPARGQQDPGKISRPPLAVGIELPFRTSCEALRTPLKCPRVISHELIVGVCQWRPVTSGTASISRALVGMSGWAKRNRGLDFTALPISAAVPDSARVTAASIRSLQNGSVRRRPSQANTPIVLHRCTTLLELLSATSLPAASKAAEVTWSASTMTGRRWLLALHSTAAPRFGVHLVPYLDHVSPTIPVGHHCHPGSKAAPRRRRCWQS